jgi:uncharacterized protein
MAKLNDEMRSLLEKQLAIVATASKDGIPNVGPKGSLYVVDDDTFLYSEGTGEKTLRNLQENPLIAIMVLDGAKVQGYQFKGKAELLSGGDYFQKMAKRQEERKRPLPKTVVKIKIEEIYSLSPGIAGKRIA